MAVSGIIMLQKRDIKLFITWDGTFSWQVSIKNWKVKIINWQVVAKLCLPNILVEGVFDALISKSSLETSLAAATCTCMYIYLNRKSQYIVFEANRNQNSESNECLLW